ncbi:MAG: ribose 5-phosphate isomerase B [Oscillospiraceae bacterium]|jgi:ribose 5-phosphate isomerase B|nr:ribose 5-phosphate isomerase B [Oscillospiraceae bacterium]
MIAIGCDHAATCLKEALKTWLQEQKVDVLDFGTFGTAKADYPVSAYKVAKAVAEGQCEKGILLCGTGVGISIAANKVKGIRAVCCSEPYSAQLSKMHNDTNILCMGARVVGSELAKMIVMAWLAVDFEGGRHKKRVDMITKIEAGTFDEIA